MCFLVYMYWFMYLLIYLFNLESIAKEPNLLRICYPPASISQYFKYRPMAPYPVRAFRMYSVFL